MDSPFSPSPPQLTAYRIADGRHPLFNGSGAMLFGARWNSQGLPAIYAAMTFAGAMLEVLAHTGGLGGVPRTHQAITIYIPDSVPCVRLAPEEVPGWDAPDLLASRAFGDMWLRAGKEAVLIVPSVIAPEERNLLINPAHVAFKDITVSQPRDVVWDARFFRGKG